MYQFIQYRRIFFFLCHAKLSLVIHTYKNFLHFIVCTCHHKLPMESSILLQSTFLVLVWLENYGRMQKHCMIIIGRMKRKESDMRKINNLTEKMKARLRQRLHIEATCLTLPLLDCFPSFLIQTNALNRSETTKTSEPQESNQDKTTAGAFISPLIPLNTCCYSGRDQRRKMNLKRERSRDDTASIRLEIVQHTSNGDDIAKDNWGSNLFEPQRQLSDGTPTGSGSRDPLVPAPEKKLTLFALRLAILEKAASGLGTLGFIWATVVLLGGFAVALAPKDFWFVTVILLIEGTRIFSRSHELEWQHQATTWSLASIRGYSFRAIKAVFHPSLVIGSSTMMSKKKRAVAPGDQNKLKNFNTQRTWHSSDVPMIPYAGWVFISRNVSRMFYYLQLVSALACAVLSLMRLVEQDYGETSDETRNRKAALDIFYALALAESLMFLMEKAYWVWKIDYCKLLYKVNRECNLGPHGIACVKRFFYDSYSKCIEGSIFDGLKMDLVTFGSELVNSDSRDEQLIGVQILLKFATNERFGSYTLRRIGTSTLSIERLIEMLNWKSPSEEEIRRSAAEIVSKLAGKKQNAIRVAAIPGAMESISSLLSTGQADNHDFSAFNLLGLLILKKLARDHDNCGKIGSSRGLMPKIIDFTCASESLLRDGLAPESQIKIVKRSLQLVKILVSTTGQTGKMLRKDISDIVFTVSNIREILQYGESHMMLQKLGIEVLTSLAMDEEARERIGSTGRAIKLLLSIFFKPLLTEEQNSVSAEAGEALAMLALENTRNCELILKEDVVGELITLLNDPVLQVNSSRILMNLCAYSAPECSIQLVAVTSAVPTVLKAIMVAKEKLLEVSIGLAKQIFRFISAEEYDERLKDAGIEDADFAKQLVEILKRYTYPEIKVPRIRRLVIELMIWLMNFRGEYIRFFKELAADEVMKCVADTTSELECFSVFSGSVGLGRNNITLSNLVDTALELMGQG